MKCQPLRKLSFLKGKVFYVFSITILVFPVKLTVSGSEFSVSPNTKVIIESAKLPENEGELTSHSNSSAGDLPNNITDYIRNGELATVFCERCTASQKEKVEQILYLLYNFSNAGVPSSSSSHNEHPKVTLTGLHDHTNLSTDKSYILLKKKNLKKIFKATAPPGNWKRHTIATPQTFQRGFQLPSKLSTTPASVTSPGYSSMAIPIVPYFYSSTLPTSSVPGLSPTVSSALEPVQSVEIPTPPMPPTTTGPVYLYYMGGRESSSSYAPSSSLSSSGSLEPPTTPVAESSMAYASRPTTA